MRTTEQVEDWLRNTVGCQTFVRADTDTHVKIFHSTDPVLHQLFMQRLLGLNAVESRNDRASIDYVWSSSYVGRITVIMLTDRDQHFPSMIVVNTYYAPEVNQ